jgi:4-hydroxybenzoate polyprenyltransferase
MLFHVITLICLVIIGVLAPELGIVYYIGILLITGLFIMEYRIISPTNLTNVNIASYSINQLVSIVLLISGVVDALML